MLLTNLASSTPRTPLDTNLGNGLSGQERDSQVRVAGQRILTFVPQRGSLGIQSDDAMEAQQAVLLPGARRLLLQIVPETSRMLNRDGPVEKGAYRVQAGSPPQINRVLTGRIEKER